MGGEEAVVPSISNGSVNLGWPWDLLSSTNKTIPTLPFGLNLGRAGHWSGSLVFGGDYDSNRVAADTWTIITASDSFISTGNISPWLQLKQGASKDAGDGYFTNIALNEDVIRLPAEYDCGSDIYIESPQTLDSWVTLPSYFMTGRCTVGARGTSDDPVVLGVPFFQATYTFVSHNGAVWAVQAHGLNLGPFPDQFVPTAAVRIQPCVEMYRCILMDCS